jgi:cytochrome c553
VARTTSCRARVAGLLLLATALGASAAPTEFHLQLCAACHGPGGNSDNPVYPKLAGADPDYTARQLEHYKNGKRKHGIMSQIVMTIEDASIRDLAEYYGEQKRSPGKVADAALAEKGRAIFDNGIAATGVPSCASCHGSEGLGDGKYPRLAAQHTAYEEAQLRAFRSGERANDAKGAMGDVARRLTDDDIRAVIQYLASLKPDE